MVMSGLMSSNIARSFLKQWLEMISELRNCLVNISSHFLSLQIHFDNKTLELIHPTLKPGEQLHVPIYQDKTIIWSNKLCQQVQARSGRLPIQKKGQEKSIHISDFIIELYSHLKLTPD